MSLVGVGQSHGEVLCGELQSRNRDACKLINVIKLGGNREHVFGPACIEFSRKCNLMFIVPCIIVVIKE